MNDPELSHKGEWLAWFGAVLVFGLNALSILFADELFRWNLAFQIRNADHAEPSDWEIAGRYIGWTVLTIMALVLFIVGLQYTNRYSSLQNFCHVIWHVGSNSCPQFLHFNLAFSFSIALPSSGVSSILPLGERSLTI